MGKEPASQSDKNGAAETNCSQTSNEDLLKGCLEHYERVSTIAHEWNNQVPQAIRAWYAARSAEPAVSPVAWCYTNKATGTETLTRQPPDRVLFPDDYEITPLFSSALQPWFPSPSPGETRNVPTIGERQSCGVCGAYSGDRAFETYCKREDCPKLAARSSEVAGTVPRRLAPLCEEHGSGPGARSICPYCALLKLQAALSKIDYLCGKPNDMEVSGYDVFYNEDAVVENVKRALAAPTLEEGT